MAISNRSSNPAKNPRAPAPSKTAPAADKAAGKKDSGKSVLREWCDELIFVFTIVLFIKMFLVELYKIPSGSMTPTLLGGLVAHVDVNADKKKDIVFFDQNRQAFVFVRQNDRYIYDPGQRVTPSQFGQWRAEGKIRDQKDRILVNKLAYNFSPPHRGDIVVFKVPPRIFKPEAPIYIKRCAGEPGDHLSFTPEGRLITDGKSVDEPPFYRTQHYDPELSRHATERFEMPEVQYEPTPRGVRILGIDVPENQYYVFGDNAQGSLDSRFWGGVPFENFKGRAFMRIWPLPQLKFLD